MLLKPMFAYTIWGRIGIMLIHENIFGKEIGCFTCNLKGKKSGILSRVMDRRIFKLDLRFKVNYIIIMVLALVSVMAILEKSSMATADYSGQKKAVVLILDEISLSDLIESKTPTIDELAESGAMGFMNVRSRSSVANKASNYLSLGMGTRTLASTQGHLAFNRESLYAISENTWLGEESTAESAYKLYTGKAPTEGEIVNVAFADVARTVMDVTPNYQVGLLGKTARENGLTIGLLGNRDSDGVSRQSSLLAMDENGLVPLGSVGQELLLADDTVLGGLRLDQDKMMEEVERILPQTDILFIDYGDAVRVEDSNRLATDEVREEQRVRAVERADAFLGQVSERLDNENTLYMVITPNPSRASVAGGNFGITPIVVSGLSDEQGLLSSSTTRREGLVANFDFGPTLLNYFGVEEVRGFGGVPMEIKSSNNPLETLKEMLMQSLYLRSYRHVFHWLYIAIIGVFLVCAYLPKFLNEVLRRRNLRIKSVPKALLSQLGVTSLLLPIMMMTVSYRLIVIDITYIVLGASLIAYIINKLLKDIVKSMALVGMVTSLMLLLDVYNMGQMMIVSPLGSDAIAGGRFYGMGNDYMGVLIGSTLLGLFATYDRLKISKAKMMIVTALYMIACVIMLSPFFGANMGGTLSAIFVLLLTLLILSEKRFSVKKVLAIGLIVAVVVIIIAGLDATFNSNPTHAGRALEDLLSDGWSKFAEIISSKVGQLVWNLLNSSWNIILFGQVIIGAFIYRFKKDGVRDLASKNPTLFKGILAILLGSVVIFAFNDTGTIATAIALSYGFIPLGIYTQDM